MNKNIKKYVQEGYAEIVQKGISCCTQPSQCCENISSTANINRKTGYSKEELNTIPESANLGLGCGNPVALASLKEGETVLDLGSGAGIDCFLAANKVGHSGRVIGVDMTPEMINRARENAGNNRYGNVEFRLGEIENLPVEDSSVDVVISNCVINLSPEKRQVFDEAYRVLKPGGRLMVSDMVLLKKLPETVSDSIDAYIGCISGAVLKGHYLKSIDAAGFRNVKVVGKRYFNTEGVADDPFVESIAEDLGLPMEDAKSIARCIVSIEVSAEK